VRACGDRVLAINAPYTRRPGPPPRPAPRHFAQTHRIWFYKIGNLGNISLDTLPLRARLTSHHGPQP
jgi:hypothetical protein